MKFPQEEDIEKLLEGQREEISTTEQLEVVKDKLNFEHYSPSTSPDTIQTESHNPAVQGYQETGLSWGECGWEPVDETECLQTYPEYVPTDEAIEHLTTYDCVLEVGAGNGYWTYVINQNGGNCTATDIYPEDLDASEYPQTAEYEGGDSEYTVTIWTDVEELAAQDALQTYPSGPVLMCHPSGANRWSEHVLNAIDDRPFIYVGEWFPGADATPWFFKTLDEEFVLESTFPIYDWTSMHAQGYVFSPQ